MLYIQLYIVWDTRFFRNDGRVQNNAKIAEINAKCDAGSVILMMVRLSGCIIEVGAKQSIARLHGGHQF